jgi:hypothetical protein
MSDLKLAQMNQYNADNSLINLLTYITIASFLMLKPLNNIKMFKESTLCSLL